MMFEVIEVEEKDLQPSAWELEEKQRKEKLDNAFRLEFAYQFQPRIFRGRQTPIEISIDEGWYSLVHNMCSEIHELIKDVPDYQIGFQWLQIKEKFGTLRAYSLVPRTILNSKVEEINAIVRKYEEESAETCEVCGKPGVQTTYGWVVTLCKEHAEERKIEQQKRYGLTIDV